MREHRLTSTPQKRRVLSGNLVAAPAAVLLILSLKACEKGPDWKSQGRVPFPSVAGPALAERRLCTSCHAGGGTAAPLTGRPGSRDRKWVEAHLTDPEFEVPASPDPENPVPPGQASVLLAWLEMVEKGPLPEPDPREREQILLMTRENCFSCHRIDGAGGRTGPNLSGVAERRDRQWIVSYLPDPEAVFADSKMRSYPHLTAEERETIADYLMRFR